MLCEFFLDHPFPRVEFEQVVDGVELGVQENFVRWIVSDFLHVQVFRFDTSLGGRIAKVGDVAEVFVVICGGGEMDSIPALLSEVSPSFDQLFVDTIELIERGDDLIFGLGIFEPVPLNDGGFEEGGWCIGVVFEKFGR